jgi:hypothetical protein
LILEHTGVGQQGDALLTKIVASALLICALLDTVATDALIVMKNFVTIFTPRSRKRHSTATSARAVDVEIESRPTARSRRRSGWAKPRRVAPERS